MVALRCVRTEVCSGEGKRFVNLFEEVLGSLQEEFRKRIKNLPILVEDAPPRVIL
jgi:predicted Zn-dependent protease with MMP-like domain